MARRPRVDGTSWARMWKGMETGRLRERQGRVTTLMGLMCCPPKATRRVEVGWRGARMGRERRVAALSTLHCAPVSR